MAENITGFQVGANINPFEASMRRLVDSAKAGQGGVGAALGSLAGGPLAGLQAAFAGIAAVLSGGFLAVAIRDTAAMTESAMNLSRALGISTNEAKAVQMAMEDIGAQTGEFEGAAKGMARQLKDNEAAMNKMGLVTRDAAGNLRPMNDLVIDGIKALGDYKEGTDRTLAGQALFGRGIDASSKLMLYNRDVLEENKKAMQEMGLEVGENAVKAWGEYDSAMDRAGFGMQGFGKAIGDSLMPVMVTLVDMFNAVAPAAIKGLRIALAGLTTVFLVFKNTVVHVAEVTHASLFTLIEPLRGIFEALYKGVTGDFSGAADAFTAIGKNVGDVWQVAMTRMLGSSSKTRDQIVSLFSEDVASGSGGGSGKGTKNFVNQGQRQGRQRTIPNANLRSRAGPKDRPV
jgi:TP901 family phage tail tape measure protein